MKRLVLIFMVVAALTQVALARVQTRDTVMGIAFYNLENLFDTINNNGKYDLEFSPRGSREWDSHKYRSKINRLAKTIASFATPLTPAGPAMIGVAEVENESVVYDLVTSEPLRDRGLGYVHHDSPDRRGIDVALLYDPQMFTVESISATPLIIEDNPGLRTRDQLCVTGSLLGEPIAVIVNHWPSRLGGQKESSPLREAAAALTLHIADSLRALRPDIGIIVMGDLNDDPMDRSCALVLGAEKYTADTPYDGFYNPFWTVLENGKGTLSYKGRWNLFDQIIVSGSFVHPRDGQWRFLNPAVLDFDFLKNGPGRYVGQPLRTYASGRWLDGYSDHFPTEIFLVKSLSEE